MLRTIPLAAALLALAACSDKPRSEPLAGSDDSCIGSFLMGTATKNTSACTACGDQGEENAIDGDRDSYGSAYQTGGTYSLRATAPDGVEFPAGNFAGALMLIPAAYSPGTVWTISTYLDDVPQETRNAGNAEGGDPANPGGEDDYYGFTTTLPFDSVEITMNGGSSDALNVSSNPVRWYEFCGQRQAQR